MWRLLLALSFIPAVFACAGGSGYSFCRPYTIDHTKVPNTSRTNFTVLVSSTDVGFKTVANSGHINNTVVNNGQTVPADLIFSTTASCTSLTSWNVEHYVATTGEIQAWVLVPTLSFASDTVIWACYGKVSVVAFQGGAAGAAYDAATVAVYHLPNGTVLSGADWSANANTGTITGAVAGVGKIDGGSDMDVDNISAAHIAALDSVNITVSAWIKTADAGVAESIIDRDNHTSDRSYQFRMASGKLQFIPFLAGGNDGIAGAVTINDNVFHFLVATYDGTTARQYVDGVADGTNAAFGGNLNSAAGIGIVLGDAAGTGGQNFVGIIDEAKQVNVARSADWVVTEFNNQSNPGTFATLGAEQAASSSTSQSILF